MRQRPNGFTLIELLIVVVIIGILAAIAIPKFANTKEQAYLATMKSDLRNLATAQESYQYENGAYYSGAIPSAVLNFYPSSGVTITLASVTASGFQATSAHAMTPKTCAMYMGSAAPLAPATIEGVPKC
jgi:prepilin-type N-terminal cleavage/methylation domain-containing protein